MLCTYENWVDRFLFQHVGEKNQEPNFARFNFKNKNARQAALALPPT
jgi:hypothetical protein